MHIAIPFSMDTVKASFGKTHRIWGRVVANHDFLEALATAEACRRITLVVQTQADVQLLQDTLFRQLPETDTVVHAIPFPLIERHFDAYPPDVMHTLDPGMWIAGYVRSQLCKRRFPVTGITHSLANQHFLTWALENNANGIDDGDCLICTTTTARSVVESVFGRLRSLQPDFRSPQTRVVPLGTFGGDSLPDRRQARANSGFAEGDFVVLSLARFNYSFKLDYLPLLNLAATLRTGNGQRVRLLLAGSADDGRYAQFVADEARNRGLDDVVLFVLNPDETRKAELVAAADVFLSLSDNIQETFGLTLIEAMSAGLPVIASDWDGYKDLVVDGETGFLIPTKMLQPADAIDRSLPCRPDSILHTLLAQSTAVDLERTRERILALRDDDALRGDMAAAAKARSGTYQWSEVIGKYTALWAELAAAYGGSRCSETTAKPRSSAFRFLDDFSQYSTSALGGHDRFETSQLGHDLLGGRLQLRLYQEMQEVLDFELLTMILRETAASAGISVDEILESAAIPDKFEREQAMQNLLWLYKYGYISLTN